MFNHVDIELPELKRETIDGVRYYKVPGASDQDLIRLVSITSVISHKNRDKFSSWRKKVGEEKANLITKQSTSRGTDFHTLVEQYLKNLDCNSDILPLSEMMFQCSIKTLNNIDNVHCLEQSLYSKELGIAGTVDCIAEYNGELAIIDFKTSKSEKPRDWIDHYFVQCAAYACMLYEITGIIVKKFVIIMACEDGDCVVYEEYDKAKYIKLLHSYIMEFVQDKLKDYQT